MIECQKEFRRETSVKVKRCLVRIVVNLNIINHLVWLKERIIFAVFNVREYGLKKLARVPVRIIRDMVKALLEHVIIARNHIEHNRKNNVIENIAILCSKCHIGYHNKNRHVHK